jgi:hypothetical protein
MFKIDEISCWAIQARDFQKAFKTLQAQFEFLLKEGNSSLSNSKEEAIAFHKWAYKNEWAWWDNKYWLKTTNKKVDDTNRLSDEQLYLLFKKEE